MTAPHTPFTAVRQLARRLDESPRDYDQLLEMSANKRYVLLGESTHGTREFYRLRAEITRRLVTELGFDTIAIEGDWPDTSGINRFVCGQAVEDADAALSGFERFPQWMWRNREVRDFLTWLRDYNRHADAARQTGVFGLDLYSLYRSADAVISYLETVDPDQAHMARERYARLDHVRDVRVYGRDAAKGLRPGVHEAVLQQLLDIRKHGAFHAGDDAHAATAAHFVAERNAAVVVAAEAYYRAMFGSRINTWNLRDAHMVDTLFSLSQHRRAGGGSGRVVVWAHNSHLGDARATQAAEEGEWNVGQLVREAQPDSAILIGFTTYTGHVSAASDWDGSVEHKWVRPARRDSYESLFHSTRLDRFFLRLDKADASPLRRSMLERAIGVIYRPQTERASHYFTASISAQFDALFHLDETEAVEPLDAPTHWYQREAADTFPFGL